MITVRTEGADPPLPPVMVSLTVIYPFFDDSPSKISDNCKRVKINRLVNMEVVNMTKMVNMTKVVNMTTPRWSSSIRW